MSGKVVVQRDNLDTLGSLTLYVIDTPEYKIVEEYLQDESETALSAAKRLTELSHEAARIDNKKRQKTTTHAFNTLASVIELASINPPGKAHDKLLAFLDKLRQQPIKDPNMGWVIQIGVTGNERLWSDLPGLHEAVFAEMLWYYDFYRSNDFHHKTRRENLVYLLARTTAREEPSFTRRSTGPLDYTFQAQKRIKEAFQPLLRIANRPGVAIVEKASISSLRQACIWITYCADYFWKETVKADIRMARPSPDLPYIPPINEFCTQSWRRWEQALKTALDIFEDRQDGVLFQDGPASDATKDLVKKTYDILKKDRLPKP